MSIKRVLLILSGSASDTAAAGAAFLIAERLSAHIEGVHVQGDFFDSLPYIEASLSEGTIAREFALALERKEENERSAHDAFEAACAAAEASMVNWQVRSGRVADVVGYLGRVYDLTVISPNATFVGVLANAVVASALFETGHPVLVTPESPVTTLGQRILVGWNRDTQAARAVASALPLLKAAEAVTVAYVETGAKTGPGPEELCTNLAGHGIEATARQIEPGGNSVAESLLGAAEEVDADLIVIGAYSHSRLREMVLGGVTNDMLDQLKMPILMAH